MLHTFDFDAARLDMMDDAALSRNENGDPVRVSRGLLTGLALGAALWAGIIAAIVSVN